MNKGCSFTDAAALAKAHPDSFKIPSKEALARVHNGYFVKVNVEFIPQFPQTICGERFWLWVNHIEPDGRINGTINNDLVYTPEHGLQSGDVITVERRHIYEILEY